MASKVRMMYTEVTAAVQKSAVGGTYSPVSDDAEERR